MFKIKQRIYHWLTIAISALALHACGGGGDPSIPDDLSDIGIIQVTLTISTSSSTLTQGTNQNNTINVLLTDQNGTVLPDELIQLSSTLGVVDGNGTAITNDSGIATFNVTVTEATEGDSGTLVASYVNEDANIDVDVALNVTAGPPEDNFVLTMTVIDNTTLEETDTLDPNNGNTITVSLQNNNVAASGETIAISSTIGALSATSVTTNSDGIAQVTLDSSDVNESFIGTITATHRDSNNSAITSSQTVSGGALQQTASLFIQVGDGSSNIISQEDTTNILVTLTGNSGEALTNKIVSLSSSGPGTISGSGSVLTNSQGIATFQMTLSGETEGNAFTLIANYTEDSVSAQQSLNVAAGPSPSGANYSLSIEALSLTADNQLNGFSGNTLQITLSSDSAQGIVSDRIITLSPTLGTLSNTSIRTDANGIATTTLYSSGIAQGTAGSVTASFDDGAGASASPATLILEAGPSASLNISVQGATETPPVLSQSEVNTIVVELIDPLGDPVTNALVSLEPPFGVLDGNGDAVTNNNGQAAFTLNLSDVDENTIGQLNATYIDIQRGISLESSINVKAGEESDDEPDALFNVSLVVKNAGGSAITTLDPVNGNTIEVTVVDHESNPVPGVIVTLDNDIGVLDTLSLLTDSSGVASTVLRSGTEIPGFAAEITATYTKNTISYTDSYRVQAGQSISLAIAVDGATTSPPQLSQTATNVINVTLQDANGSPLPNRIVGLISGLGTVLGNQTAATDASGIATFELILTNATKGDAGLLTASFTDTTTGISDTESLSVVAGDAAPNSDFSLAIEALSLTASDQLDSFNGNTIQVTLSNTAGASVSNRIITLTPSFGLLSATTLRTNDAGVATTTFYSGGIAQGTAGTIIAEFNEDDDAINTVLVVEAGPDASFDINVIGSDDTPQVVSQTAPNSVQITMTDPQGNPIPNALISTTMTMSTSVSTASDVTDDNGSAIFSLSVTNMRQETIGQITATYTDNTKNIDISHTINVVAGEENTSSEDEYIVELELTDGTGVDSNVLTPDSGNTLQVRLTDSDGVGQGGQILQISSTFGVVSPVFVLTSADGYATSTLSSSEVAAGEAWQITASFTNGEITYPASINVQAGESSGSGATGDVSLSVTVQDDVGDETNTLNTSLGNNIRIVLEDLNGDPISSEIITVASTIGTLEPSSGGETKVLTNSNGVASARIFSEGLELGTAGTITVTYTDPISGDQAVEIRNVQAGETLGSSDSVTTLVATLYEKDSYLNNLPTATQPNSSATQISQINAIQPAILEVRMTTDGAPVEGAIITVENDLGTISPASGKILTNDLGIATLTLSIGTAESGEAGTIFATTSDNLPSNDVTFSIGSSNLALGYFDGGGAFIENDLLLASNAIVAGGSTQVTVNVVNTADGNSSYTNPLDINFTSDCVLANLATIDSPVTTSAGTATAKYIANGCTSDTITATIANIDGPIANSDITIAGSTASSISFLNATPPSIALKGTGGNERAESSALEFYVQDNTGAPESNVLVNFSLSTTVGGISLEETSSTTDAEGKVFARVNSGTIPTSVRVLATIDGTTLSTLSDTLIISTGLPDQRSFTLGASVLTPGGGDVNGITSDVTIRAADAFNNPVPDGTAVSFTTEYGAIGDSCTTVSGTCTVTWTSQDPRQQINQEAKLITVDTCENNWHGGTFSVDTTGMPCLNPDFSQPHASYTSVLAYAVGEETFIDANANGLFDTGELFEDKPEAFIDHNDNNAFDNPNTTGNCNQTGGCPSPTQGGDEETFIDFNENFEYDGANGMYNGSLCSDDAEAAGDCTSDLIYVYDEIRLAVAGSDPYFLLYRNIDGQIIGGSGSAPAVADFETSPTVDLFDAGLGYGGSARFTLYISDKNNGPLPGGTTIDVSSSNCEVNSETTIQISESARTYSAIGIHLTQDDEETEGDINIKVTLPASHGSSEYLYSFGCLDLAP